MSNRDKHCEGCQDCTCKEKPKHLTEGQREALSRAGWVRDDSAGHERWSNKEDHPSRIYGDLSCSGNLTLLFKAAQLLPSMYDYNEDDPVDCHRAAVDMIKRAAGLCASAVGALDYDQRTYKSRKLLMGYRHTLSLLAHWLEVRMGPNATPALQEGEKNNG